jgi:hypothetical protein
MRVEVVGLGEPVLSLSIHATRISAGMGWSSRAARGSRLYSVAPQATLKSGQYVSLEVDSSEDYFGGGVEKAA